MEIMFSGFCLVWLFLLIVDLGYYVLELVFSV